MAEPNQFSVLTYNIWFDAYRRYNSNLSEREDRMQLLSKEIERLDPDLIALQEVTKPLLSILSKLPWIQRYPFNSLYNSGFR
jgi:mRNA deadenylase 3'-5' endonuclease subunit Ccr4